MKPTPLKNNEISIWLRTKQIKNYPKIMYDCHTDRKTFTFFDSVHNDPTIITFPEKITPPLKDKKIPPSNFGTLNLASKSHTNIFL